jgi:hypothetical protein
MIALLWIAFHNASSHQEAAMFGCKGATGLLARPPRTVAHRLGAQA